MKRKESLSGRFADILAQMYMLTASLKRFREEGERKEDEVLLKVAMENGFNKIDEAFAGIYSNLSKGFLGMIFKIAGFYSRINSFGSVIKDYDLHKIASLLSSNSDAAIRLCSNIYMGGRVGELLRASQAMQDAREAISKLKHQGEQALDENEKSLIKRAKKLQGEIVAVDSYSHGEYFRC